MTVIEDDLRQALHAHAPAGQVPVAAALAAGRRIRLARRAAPTVAAVVMAAAAVMALTGGERDYRLAGDGLTLSKGPGVQQIDAGRVDMGDGIQAWRDGETLGIGYPARPYATIDTTSINSRWADLGYDTVVFDDPGEHDGWTTVVGTVRGEPTSVVVTVDGVSEEATVACFRQALGWCAYKAKVPSSWQSPDSLPKVLVK
jgi:hypothetical protein